MGPREFFTKMFMRSSDVSSKRFFGAIGWTVCIGICIYCVVSGLAAPDIIETLFYCTAGLLGLDSVTSAWKGTPKREQPKDNEGSSGKGKTTYNNDPIEYPRDDSDEYNNTTWKN